MIRIKNYIMNLSEITLIELDDELLKVHFKNKTSLFITNVNETLFNDLWCIIIEQNKERKGD